MADDNTNAVRLATDGPQEWTGDNGRSASQAQPVVDGLSAEEADTLVANEPFVHVDDGVTSGDTSTGTDETASEGSSESTTDASTTEETSGDAAGDTSAEEETGDTAGDDSTSEDTTTDTSGTESDTSTGETTADETADGSTSEEAAGGGESDTTTGDTSGTSEDSATDSGGDATGETTEDATGETSDGSTAAPDAPADEESEVSKPTDESTPDMDAPWPPYEADPDVSPLGVDALVNTDVEDELEPWLEARDLSREDLHALGAAEAAGEERVTAFEAINEELRSL